MHSFVQLFDVTSNSNVYTIGQDAAFYYALNCATVNASQNATPEDSLSQN